jgi:hypothetical protein
MTDSINFSPTDEQLDFAVVQLILILQHSDHTSHYLILENMVDFTVTKILPKSVLGSQLMSRILFFFNVFLNKSNMIYRVAKNKELFLHFFEFLQK